MNLRSSSELWVRGLVAGLAVYVMLLVSSGALFAQPVAPVISKSFGVASVLLNGITTLSITIANNGSVTLTGVGFIDNLPSGLAVPSSSSSPCGGTLTVTGGNTITLTGATIAANTTCGVLLTNVQGQTAGTKVNTTSTVSSNEAGAGGPATAVLLVAPPPTPAPSSLLLLAMGLLALMSWQGWRMLRHRSQ